MEILSKRENDWKWAIYPTVNVLSEFMLFQNFQPFFAHHASVLTTGQKTFHFLKWLQVNKFPYVDKELSFLALNSN